MRQQIAYQEKYAKDTLNEIVFTKNIYQENLTTIIYNANRNLYNDYLYFTYYYSNMEQYTDEEVEIIKKAKRKCIAKRATLIEQSIATKDIKRYTETLENFCIDMANTLRITDEDIQTTRKSKKFMEEVIEKMHLTPIKEE